MKCKTYVHLNISAVNQNTENVLTQSVRELCHELVPPARTNEDVHLMDILVNHHPEVAAFGVSQLKVTDYSYETDPDGINALLVITFDDAIDYAEVENFINPRLWKIRSLEPLGLKMELKYAEVLFTPRIEESNIAA